MNWIILIIAGFFEIAWAIGLKLSDNLHDLKWTIFTLITLILSMYLLSVAMKTLPLGTAYTVWTGIGAIGTVILGIYLFKEPIDFWRIFFLSMIFIGILGLRFSGK
jgi:quaternary ammonium compound-resistance protein SugE